MIHDHQTHFDVTLMCRLLDVSRQGYYDWVDRPAPPSAARRDAIVAAIRPSHALSPIAATVRPTFTRTCWKRASPVARVNTVAKRMREHGIRSVVVNRRFRITTTDSDHDQPVFDNRLDRDFTADGPDRKCAAATSRLHPDP
jgi:hypothetical protein